MSNLKNLIAQRDALEVQITELLKGEHADAIVKTRALIEEYQLTAAELFNGVRKAKTGRVAGTKVAAKYLDPVSGKTWSGRGLAPKWLTGKDKAQFLIA
jgi:DNA-binding protein H-NS